MARVCTANMELEASAELLEKLADLYSQKTGSGNLKDGDSRVFITVIAKS